MFQATYVEEEDCRSHELGNVWFEVEIEELLNAHTLTQAGNVSRMLRRSETLLQDFQHHRQVAGPQCIHWQPKPGEDLASQNAFRIRL